MLKLPRSHGGLWLHERGEWRGLRLGQELQWTGSAGERRAGRDGCTDGTAAAAAPPGGDGDVRAGGDVSGWVWRGWEASFLLLRGALGRLEKGRAAKRVKIWGARMERKTIRQH